MREKVKITVMASGGGSNFQSLIDFCKNEDNIEIVQLIASNSRAFAIERAKNNNIKNCVVGKSNYPNDNERMDKIIELLHKEKTDLVVLAGYLGILSKKVIEKYRGKIINIHPSLLPKFGGKDCYGIKVHEKVIEAKEEVSGATVHFVDEGIDTGEIILQEKVPVYKGDTPKDLAERVLKIEHEILVKAVKIVIDTKLRKQQQLVKS